MAKKNQKSAKPAEAAKAKASPSNLETAFASGNYAAVKLLAKSDTSETAQKLLGLTKIDMVQVAVGLFAIAVLLTAALLTLH